GATTLARAIIHRWICTRRRVRDVQIHGVNSLPQRKAARSADSLGRERAIPLKFTRLLIRAGVMGAFGGMASNGAAVAQTGAPGRYRDTAGLNGIPITSQVDRIQCRRRMVPTTDVEASRYAA
ncbi:MAG: hypothetical protein ACRYGL_18115, partial [Janthinobacterium lividum]